VPEFLLRFRLVFVFFRFYPFFRFLSSGSFSPLMLCFLVFVSDGGGASVSVPPEVVLVTVLVC
jgi:hypothetical protein